MAIDIDTIDRLQEYLSGVIGRARHHAPNVREVILLLAGVVVLFKDADEPIQGRGEGDSLKNVLWVHIGGVRFAFSYNHQHQSIEIRRRSLQGRVIGSFNNQTPPEQVLRTFERLRGSNP